MNSPFSEVSHRQSRKSIVGFVGYEFEPESRIAACRILYSLKAAIVSSIESNCCATSVVEGIFKQWEVVEVGAVKFAPRCATLGLGRRLKWRWRELKVCGVIACKIEYVRLVKMKENFGLFQKSCLLLVSVIADSVLEMPVMPESTRGSGR